MIDDLGIDKGAGAPGSPVQEMALERFFSSSMVWVGRHRSEVGRGVGDSLRNSYQRKKRRERKKSCNNTLISKLYQA